MKGAVFVALAATIGNFLQGWDNATIAGNISCSFVNFPLIFYRVGFASITPVVGLFPGPLLGLHGRFVHQTFFLTLICLSRLNWATHNFP